MTKQRRMVLPLEKINMVNAAAGKVEFLVEKVINK
jgi:hypothetical protein